jgi:HEAT repeat protein
MGMDQDHVKTPQPEAEAGSSEAPDKAAVEKAKDIFHILSNTVTTMKLYPSQHASVTKFVDELYSKLRDYFERWPELEVDIQENAFLMRGEEVFRDDNLIKSLPYLFHKDGMEKMAILNEIEKTELHTFLEVIRQTSLLPLDESDIVVAIWEKDLANIRIFAPDDYLLAKIDVFTKQPFDIFIDPKKLFSGQIELSTEDLKDIQSKGVSLGLMELEDKKDYAQLVTMLEDKDIHQIDTMLSSSRRIPPEKEFLDMIFELLYLEDRIQEFATVLGFLDRHHKDLIRDGKFTHAAQFLGQMQELKGIFSEQNPAKAAELEKFLNAVKEARTVALIRECIERKNIDSVPSFFDYLRFLGDKSIPLAAELLEENQTEDYRRAALAYLEDIAPDSIETLASQLQDGKPDISKSIISLLGQSQDRRSLAYLAPLVTYTNKDIRLAAIATLGSFQDPLAQKILSGFLQAEDEDIRLAAADRLGKVSDKTILRRVIRMVSGRRFHDKSSREKIAVLGILGRSTTPEGLEALRKAMEKSGFFGKARRDDTRLCAVAVLEAMETPEALDILGKGVKSSNKKVSEACREALEKRLP